MKRHLSRFRRQATFGNTAALVALVVSLGGTAWAAATINSGHIVDNTIRSKDLRNGEAVASADVVNGSLGLADISGTAKSALRGQQGPQGIPGTNGNDGNTGLQGIQGEQGEQGEEGIQGEQGEAGESGFSEAKARNFTTIAAPDTWTEIADLDLAQGEWIVMGKLTLSAGAGTASAHCRLMTDPSQIDVAAASIPVDEPYASMSLMAFKSIGGGGGSISLECNDDGEGVWLEWGRLVAIRIDHLNVVA